jgi:hypothetical protein
MAIRDDLLPALASTLDDERQGMGRHPPSIRALHGAPRD